MQLSHPKHLGTPAPTHAVPSTSVTMETDDNTVNEALRVTPQPTPQHSPQSSPKEPLHNDIAPFTTPFTTPITSPVTTPHPQQIVKQNSTQSVSITGPHHNNALPLPSNQNSNASSTRMEIEVIDTTPLKPTVPISHLSQPNTQTTSESSGLLIPSNSMTKRVTEVVPDESTKKWHGISKLLMENGVNSHGRQSIVNHSTVINHYDQFSMVERRGSSAVSRKKIARAQLTPLQMIVKERDFLKNDIVKRNESEDPTTSAIHIIQFIKNHEEPLHDTDMERNPFSHEHSNGCHIL